MQSQTECSGCVHALCAVGSDGGRRVMREEGRRESGGMSCRSWCWGVKSVRQQRCLREMGMQWLSWV